MSDKEKSRGIPAKQKKSRLNRKPWRGRRPIRVQIGSVSGYDIALEKLDRYKS
jgi:hypothetical protein